MKKEGEKDKYKEILNKINTSNITIFFDNMENIEEINKLNINFIKINKFMMNCYSTYDEKKSKSFFNSIFSINGINNLRKLYLLIPCKIDEDLFKNINNFKNLEDLSLSNFKFNSTFNLEIKSLKILSISYSERLSFERCENLKRIYLTKSYIPPSTLVAKFPNLEKLIFDSNYFTTFLNKVFYYKDLSKLKSIHCYYSHFMLLENSPLLEDIYLFPDEKVISLNKLFEKLMSFNKLKYVRISLKDYDDNQCLNIEINKSITKLKIEIEDGEDFYELYTK